jgi:hypothetical protein
MMDQTKRKNFKLLLLLYTLTLYTIFLYVGETMDYFDSKVHFPYIPQIYYFDVCVLLVGGLLLGYFLFRMGGIINKIMGLLMITLNLTLVPFLLLSDIN